MLRKVLKTRSSIGKEVRGKAQKGVCGGKPSALARWSGERENAEGSVEASPRSLEHDSKFLKAFNSAQT